MVARFCIRRAVKLSKLASKGNAIFVGAEKFHEIEYDIKMGKLCKSDDFHILALAKFTGARVLYTKDRKLITDFKNNILIDNVIRVNQNQLCWINQFVECSDVGNELNSIAEMCLLFCCTGREFIGMVLSVEIKMIHLSKIL